MVAIALKSRIRKVSFKERLNSIKEWKKSHKKNNISKIIDKHQKVLIKYLIVNLIDKHELLTVISTLVVIAVFYIRFLLL